MYMFNKNNAQCLNFKSDGHRTSSIINTCHDHSINQTCPLSCSSKLSLQEFKTSLHYKMHHLLVYNLKTGDPVFMRFSFLWRLIGQVLSISKLVGN